jgi:hypothetical protein
LFDLATILSDLPEVPKELRGPTGYRDLFVANSVAVGQAGALEQLGWKVRDVRLLDGADRVRGVLAGLATGTINSEAVDLKQLELDAKVHGLLSRDAGKDNEQKEDFGQATLEELLGGIPQYSPAGNSNGSVVSKVAKRGRGRPPGSKNKLDLLVKQVEQIAEGK